jgi:hypothetical protein
VRRGRAALFSLALLLPVSAIGQDDSFYFLTIDGGGHIRAEPADQRRRLADAPGSIHRCMIGRVKVSKHALAPLARFFRLTQKRIRGAGLRHRLRPLAWNPRAGFPW